MRLEPGGNLFRIVVDPARHPRSGFDTVAEHVVIRILLIMTPWVVAKHRIDFQETEQENQPADQLITRDVAHPVVVVLKRKMLFEPQHAGHFLQLEEPKYVNQTIINFLT